jgi:hypothetical protein
MIVGKPGMRRPSAGRSTCCSASLALKSTEGSSDCNWLSRWAARARRLRAAQNDAQIGLQAALNGVVERKIDGLRQDAQNPLLERVKFLAITGSNLDEYVEIRQAG